MSRLFIPYSGENIAAVSIKGHRVIILSRRRDNLEEQLHLIGADRLRELRSDPRSEDNMLNSLAQEARGGLVIAPHEMQLGEVLSTLESQLSWVQ